MREKELLVYRDLGSENLLQDMAWIMENNANEQYSKQEKQELLYGCVHKLIKFADEFGFYGNIWHCYLTNLLVNNENPYSTSCEVVGETEGSINEAVLQDMLIFKEFFDYDFAPIQEKLEVKALSLLSEYEVSTGKSKVYEERIREIICRLAGKLGQAQTPLEMKEKLTKFYKEYGVGKFGLHKAFRMEKKKEEVIIRPISDVEQIYLNDLIGYEIPKQKLIDNTEAFLNGKRANNCLLFGDAGTGKSSSIKAILNEYYDKGLRIIEVYKHQIKDLNDVMEQIKNRNYKFIIYMDDLSFEEFETEYKYLKAVIEGGMESKPDNVLIYATSNRRHLIKEQYSDKDGRKDAMHASDTVQEKLSLVARFGVTIFFCAPDRKEFQQIVRILAEKHKIVMQEEDLVLEANRWEMSHGGLSGRTAQQFVNYLLGRQ